MVHTRLPAPVDLVHQRDENASITRNGRTRVRTHTRQWPAQTSPRGGHPAPLADSSAKHQRSAMHPPWCGRGRAEQSQWRVAQHPASRTAFAARAACANRVIFRGTPQGNRLLDPTRRHDGGSRHAAGGKIDLPTAIETQPRQVDVLCLAHICARYAARALRCLTARLCPVFFFHISHGRDSSP